MDIGNKIKKYRESRHMSQDELALKVYVSRQTISNWETNKNYPDIKSLSLLSNIFNVPLDDFIKEDIEKMKKIVEDEKVQKFNYLGTIYLIELITLVVSAYPLFKSTGVIGTILWIILFLIALGTAHTIEKLKKENDIQTYKEIITFCERKALTHDEEQQELGKRVYQKTLFAIATGIIALIIILIIIFIFEKI